MNNSGVRECFRDRHRPTLDDPSPRPRLVAGEYVPVAALSEAVPRADFERELEAIGQERVEAEKDLLAAEKELSEAVGRADSLASEVEGAREALSGIAALSFDRYVAPAEYAREVQRIADEALSRLGEKAE